ncbi:MAG: histidine kinase [Cyclobacteriaceae bacterium]
MQRPPKRHKILLLEDNVDDAEIIQLTLKRASYDFEFRKVDNLDLFIVELDLFQPTIVISDYNLPSTTALDAFHELKKLELDIPFIVVSGFLGDEIAVEALKQGVTDLVSKNNLERLPFAIERAIKEFDIVREKLRAEEELKINKERLELAISGSEMGTFDLDIINESIVYNHRSREILDIEDLPSEINFNYFLPKQADSSIQLEEVKHVLSNHLSGKTEIFQHEITYNVEGGGQRSAQVLGKVLEYSEIGLPLRMSGTISDITQKKRDADELVRNKTILEEAEKVGVIGSFEWDIKNDRFSCSQGFKNILELHLDEYNYDDYLQNIHPQDRKIFEEVLLRKHTVYSVEHRMLLPNGEHKAVRSTGRIVYDSDLKIRNIFGLIQDITEQRNLKSSIYRGQEQERKRISREIHDGIGQMLVAAKYRLMALDQNKENKVEDVGDIEELIDLILEEARRITKNLSSKIVEEHGLNKAIQYLVEDVRQSSEVMPKVVMSNLKDISPELSNNIYRIVQEGINNILKYAQATSVSLSIDRTEEYIKLDLSDDGIGFSEESLVNSLGNGLKNMKERTLLFNGLFDMDSIPKKGTNIHCLFPLMPLEEIDE